MKGVDLATNSALFLWLFNNIYMYNPKLYFHIKWDLPLAWYYIKLIWIRIIKILSFKMGARLVNIRQAIQVIQISKFYHV